MRARVYRLVTQAERERAVEAAQAEQLVLDLEASGKAPPAVVSLLMAFVATLKPRKKGWNFHMMSPEQNDFVVEWLFENSARPKIAIRLWNKVFIHMRDDTGEVLSSRMDLAKAIGCAPTHLSAALGELVQINALIREKDGRTSRYFINPLVGTRLITGPREIAQAKAPKVGPPARAKAPQLRLVEPA